MGINKLYKANKGTLLLFMVGLGYFSLLNYNLFAVYTKLSLFIVLIFIVLCALLSIRFETDDVVLLFVTTIYALVSIGVNEGGLGSVLTYLLAMLVITIIANIDLSVSQKKALGWLSLMALLFFVLSSLKYRTSAGWYYMRYNSINPNTLGMFVLYGYMIWYCSWGYAKPIVIRLALAMISSYSIFLLRARAMIVVLLFFIFLNIIPQKLLGPRRLFWIAILTVCIGLVFPFVYLTLYRNGVQITLWNKSLYTGREVLWSDMLRYLSQSWKTWLFGVGSNGYQGNQDLNIHNDYFAAIFNFGIVGFVIFEMWTFKYIRRALCNIADKERVAWFCMFVCVAFVLGITETTTHWSTIFIYTFLGLGMSVTKHASKLGSGKE